MPSTYVLDDDAPNPEPLILDCIYDVGPNETGFVLKWYLNNIQIYQWIPSRPTLALVSSRNMLYNKILKIVGLCISQLLRKN